MRKEDLRLITGSGVFSDDIVADGALWGVFVRSPHAHARIRGFDTGPAMAVVGARLVVTGADWKAAGLGSIPIQRRLTDADGRPPREAPWTVLAADAARHVGMPVALCIAETKAAAEEMAETSIVDWEPLPAASTLGTALADGAPQIWEAAPGNVAFRWTLGDRAATEAAMAGAAHVVEARRVSQRVVIVPMEPRAAVASFDAATGIYRLQTGNQGVAIVRDQAAHALGIDKHSLIVSTRDVGGGFGIRSGSYPEYPALLHAARLAGAPVRWTATRSEAFVSDAQARDSDMLGKLALDKEGRFLALSVDTHVALGAAMHHTGYFIATANLSRCLPGPYRIPAVHSDVTCVFTNSVPTAPYRGAGRPEAAYIVESLVEAAADRLGIDSVELRRRNMVEASQMPHVTAVGMRYCSGDFPDLLDKALAAADWKGLAARKAAAGKKGRLRGAGIGIFVEISGGVPNERAKMRLAAGGIVHVRTTIGATGQGHETIFAMLADELLGIGIDNIIVAQSDSAGFEDGGGASASRSTQMAGLAIRQAGLNLIEEAKSRAAGRFGVAAASVEYAAGQLSVPGTNHAMGLAEIVSDDRDAIDVEARIEAENTWPSGCHIAEVEIDAETGKVEVAGFVAVDDCGRVIHHEMAEGQVHGALAQGFGQVLMEHGVYDPESGQLVAGSLMDYALPRASDLPRFNSILAPSPATSNVLGVKGVGESGTVGPLPAIMNAIHDALAPLGVPRGAVAMPATPARVWEAIRAAAK